MSQVQVGANFVEALELLINKKLQLYRAEGLYKAPFDVKEMSGYIARHLIIKDDKISLKFDEGL